jgi:hypothetical protein
MSEDGKGKTAIKRWCAGATKLHKVKGDET